ncbi:MAG: cytochrome c biogenesis protein CcsA [Thermoleophilia bacterium]
MQSASTAAVKAVARSAAPRLATTTAILAAAGAALAAALLLGFWVAPTDASTLGFSQKIFYFHAPIAETALLAFGVAFVAALLYLRRGDAKYDRLGVAAVRLGLLFSLLVMVTGVIWGRAAWGAWWAWEPRLTTFLLACLLYTGYFVLRGAVEDESRRATYAALFAIVAFVDVPITFFATRFLPAGLHPVVLGPAGSGMAGRDLIAFAAGLAGMTLLFVGLLRLELGIEALREQLRELKYRLGR